MKTPAIPDNEVERLRSLNATGLLDTEYEERFDRLTRIARNVFGVKIALVTLVDRNRQWFKSCQGLEVRETPRDVSFCGHAILQRDVFVVENSLTDPRFADNPLVTEQPEIRFYAGAPLNSPDGYRIGTLCVIDDQPRRFSAEDRQSLRDLADCVEEEIGKSLRRRYYQALEALAAIRVDARSDLQSCLREGLSLGCEYLRLPFGIISSIDQDDYTVQVQVSPDGALKDGQTFDLASTYCSLTLAAGRILAIDCMAQSEFSSHPCYREFGLESYIGIPLKVGGQLYGTLNFSSPDSRIPSGFIDFDYQFVRLLAGWVSALLDRWEVDSALTRLRAVEMAVSRAQETFINRPDHRQAFAELLDEILQFTQSEYGFIGHILTDPEGQPYLKTNTITNIAWDDTSRAFYEENIAEGLEFRNLDNLFGHVISTGESVLSNDLDQDSRSAGVPEGHPAIDSFLGLPIHHGNRLVGMLGLANRPGGFLESLARELRPMLRTVGQLMEASRVQRQQRESERRLESVIEATNIGTWEWNVQTGAVILNERWANILGYRLAELEPVTIDTWKRLVHPEELPALDDRLRQHFSGELRYYDVTYRMLHKAGHWVWIHARGRVMGWSDDGHPLLMTGTHSDISKQKAAELKLTESEARLRGLFELSPVGIALIEFDTGRFVEVNDALLASTGYSRETMLEFSYWDITPKGYEVEEVLQREALLARGQYGPFEKEYVRKDGSHFPVILHGMLIEDHSGRRLIWSIVEDITERKRLALMQREFVSTVSHELRTPLTAISAALTMVSKGVGGSLPDKANDMIGLALRNSERLTDLINDILDMEKLVAGKMPLAVEDRELEPLLAQILADNRTYAERFGVECVLDAPPSAVVVSVDPKRFTQVITNLLSNAIKFSSAQGTVQVVVSHHGDQVRVSVVDHGEGVPEQFHGRLFSSFAQADSSDSRQVGGTGLGLAISKKLMDRMGGEISYRETPGGGATFYVDLPRQYIKHASGEQ